MKILFSPSETKYKTSTDQYIDKNSFIFPELFEKRMQIINLYQNYINNASNEQLMKLFGTKKQTVVEYYKGDLLDKSVLKTILRYDGVAYDYLQYNQLDQKAQEYIDQNVLIFSNLFGVLRAGDIGLPDYKLKQGEKIDNIAVEKFYNQHFTPMLDEYLQHSDILDLRAGFYEKFYKIAKPYTTMKFIKDGKVVSHWAKAYRGIVLKTMAQNKIQNTKELMDMQIENLTIVEIKQIKNKQEIVYAIN